MKIYHNPRCSKSRATLQLLRDCGIEPIVIDYLDLPPTVAELKHLCELLDVNPVELVRFKEPIAREMGLQAADERTDDAWCELISAHPVLMERPIIVANDRKAVLGRPPERALALIR